MGNRRAQRRAVDARSARTARRREGRVVADPVGRDVGGREGQHVARGVWIHDRRRDRSRAWTRDGPLQAGRNRTRFDRADGPQYPGARDDPARDPVVRHRGAGEGLSCSAGCVFPRLREHVSRHPFGRFQSHRDGAQLRREGFRALSPRDPARRLAVHSRRRALRVRADVGDADRRGDDFRAVGHRLHDDECSRIFANRCRRGRHSAVRGARQGRRRAGKSLERVSLRWHPAYQRGGKA